MANGSVAVAIDNVRRTTRPKITHKGDLVVVRHREYVGDVFTDSQNVFAYGVYVLNPANTTTFPWLAPLANRFESFRFPWLNVEFRSFASTTTSGQVVLAVDYDSKDDTDTATKTQLLNTGNSIDGPMWSNFVHRSTAPDLTRVGPWRFVDTSSSLETETDRLASAGNLFVATTPSSAGGDVGVGEIWIDYEVEFKTPVLHSGGGLGSRGSRQTVNSAAIPGTANVLQAFAAGSAQLLSSIGNPTLALVTQGNAFGVGGPPALPAVNYAPASGTPIATGNVVLAAISDFAGSLFFDYQTNSATPATPVLVSSLFTFVRQIAQNSGSIDDASINVIMSDSSNQAGNSFGSFLVDVVMPKGVGLFVTAPSMTWPANTDFEVEAFPTPVSLSAFRKHIASRTVKPRVPVSSSATSSTSDEFDHKLDALQTQFTELLSVRPK